MKKESSLAEDGGKDVVKEMRVLIRGLERESSKKNIDGNVMEDFKKSLEDIEEGRRS